MNEQEQKRELELFRACMAEHPPKDAVDFADALANYKFDQAIAWIGSLNADRWMPIDENTPRDGTWIQVWGVDFDCPMTAQWGLLNNNPHTTDFKYGWCGYGYIFTDLTHWQPLPKPPKEKP